MLSFLCQIGISNPTEELIHCIGSIAVVIACLIAVVIHLKRTRTSGSIILATGVLLLGLSFATLSIRNLVFPFRYESSTTLAIRTPANVRQTAAIEESNRRRQNNRELLSNVQWSLIVSAGILLPLGMIIGARRPEEHP